MKLERLAKLGAMVAVLGTIGCSDPVPPPAQTSLFFVIGPPGVPGPGCAVSGSYTANIGGPPSSPRRDPGVREIDGQNDTRVGCRVAGGFTLSGQAEKGATAFLLLSGQISGGMGTGHISVAAPGTAGGQLTSPPGDCTLNVSRPPFQIAEGNVWAEFSCPLVTDPSSPGAQCSARGEFVFENCEQ